MENNEINESINDQTINENNDYLDSLLNQIDELKKNSVSLSEYNRVKADNLKLTNTIVNNQQQQEKEKEQEKPKASIEDLKNSILNNDDLSSLKFVEDSLELRDRILEESNIDIFAPQSYQMYSTTEEDRTKAENTAQAFKYLVEVAQGDEFVFKNELNRITNETPIRPKR